MKRICINICFIFLLLPALQVSGICYYSIIPESRADSGNGTAQIWQFLVPDQIHYSSIPVNQVSLNAFNGFIVKRYDEPTHTWCDISALPDTILDIRMAGYSVLSGSENPDSSTLKFIGKPNSGVISISLSRTWNAAANPPDYDGWNLVGNPYPSAADWMSGGWILDNIDPVIYFFDGINFKPFNKNNLLGNGSRYIPSMQGFFVHVTSGSTGSLAADNSVRVHNSQPYYKESPKVSEVLVMDAVIDSLNDRVYIHFDQSSTGGFDVEQDAYKLFGIEKAPQIYCVLQDLEPAAVNVLPFSGPNTVVPLSFRTGATDSVVLIVSNLESFPDGTTLFLEDLKTGYWQDLFDNPFYGFLYTSGDASERFMLHFNDPNARIDNPNSNNIRVFTEHNILHVSSATSGFLNGELMVFDILGKRHLKEKIKNSADFQVSMNVVQGIYVVAIISDTGIFIKKVYIE